MPGKNVRKRQRLFDLYVKQPGHEDLTRGLYFFCPLCRKHFVREDTEGENPRLSLSHIVPKSLGGTWVTLSCTECNNSHGNKVEADLLASHKIVDWATGKGTLPVRMGDGRNVSAESYRDAANNRLYFDIKTPMESPAVKVHQQRLKDFTKSDSIQQELKFTIPYFRAGWCLAAVCQSAYLLLFKYYGYDFARRPAYQFLRERIVRPNDDAPLECIFQLQPDVAVQFLEQSQAAVVFVRDPVKAILAVLRFRSPGGNDLFLAVGLPGPDEAPPTHFDLTGAVFVSVKHDPEFIQSQQGSFWMDWHNWLQLEA
jgi:hypothetical protein